MAFSRKTGRLTEQRQPSERSPRRRRLKKSVVGSNEQSAGGLGAVCQRAEQCCEKLKYHFPSSHVQCLQMLKGDVGME